MAKRFQKAREFVQSDQFGNVIESLGYLLEVEVEQSF